MSPCVRLAGGVVCFSHAYMVKAKSGRNYRFEWHRMCGPNWITCSGAQMRRIPQEAWDALSVWLKSDEGKKACPHDPYFDSLEPLGMESGK